MKTTELIKNQQEIIDLQDKLIESYKKDNQHLLVNVKRCLDLCDQLWHNQKVQLVIWSLIAFGFYFLGLYLGRTA